MSILNTSARYIYKDFGSEQELQEFVDQYHTSHPDERLELFRKISHRETRDTWIWGEFGPGRPDTYMVHYLECGFTRLPRSEAVVVNEEQRDKSTVEARERLCGVLGLAPGVVDDWVIFSVCAVRIQRLEQLVEELKAQGKSK